MRNESFASKSLHKKSPQIGFDKKVLSVSKVDAAGLCGRCFKKREFDVILEQNQQLNF